jgi:Tannase and feruloyl esterase
MSSFHQRKEYVMHTVKKASSILFRRLLSDAVSAAVSRASERSTEVMKTITLALTLAAAALLGGASTVRADTNCTGTLTGTVKGNVTVPKDASCTIEIATVTGNVKVSQGASLMIAAYDEPSKISGNVEADHCKFVLLGGNVTVGGNLQIHQCTGTANNGFQGPGVKISGDFECHNNSGPCRAWLGEVDGNVQIRNNGSITASDISLVTIGGDLQCKHNTPAPTHNYGPDWVTGNLQDQCAANRGFAAKGTSIVSPGRAPGAGVACESLASLTDFPVPNTVITSATDTPATATLPERCIVNGIVNEHISPVDGCPYGDGFQVQLPLPSDWNGRLMLQGGGGSEGAVPTATGSAGTLSPAIAHGYAVASQDGGHENSQLAVCATKNPNEYYLDPHATIGYAYESIQVTTLNAKFLIDAYYGQGPNHSYWVGCSEGGRQGMVMSQKFSQYFDGIVAGDPVYDIEKLTLSELYGVQQIYNSYSVYPGGTVPRTSSSPPQPLDSAAFPAADQNLFTTALLQACDTLDGVADGVVDNLPACQAMFDPTTATYVSGGTTFSLQCTGAKTPNCLLPTQIQAAEKINQGPRNSIGQVVLSPAGAVAEHPVDTVAQGYIYDGGFMTPNGIPTRKIGTPTSPPGDYTLGVGQFDFFALVPPDPIYDPLNFNFDTGPGMLNPSTPVITDSTSLDISKFVNLGHKIIWYHGWSDPGPPALQTVNYYNEMANQHGGLEAAQQFSRFYPIPNMGHCGGGPSTDQFDMLTPLVQWVENGVAPGPIIATGTNFAATTAGYGAGLSSDVIPGLLGPTTRSRRLCPYPQQARYIGSTTAGLSDASNYECIVP